jgi:hypothetical protein
LDAGRVKRIFKSALGDGLRNILADACVYLFKHHPATPAVKGAVILEEGIPAVKLKSDYKSNRKSDR